MTEQIRSEDGAAPRTAPPNRVRLPGFIKDEEVGLGDAIKRVTYRFGLQPCGGCEQRTTALNRWMVFTR
jgi:hypothetical protein